MYIDNELSSKITWQHAEWAEGRSSENAETQELTKRAILLLLSGRDRHLQYVGSAAGYGSSFFLIEQAARLLAGRLSDERKQAGENPGTPP